MTLLREMPTDVSKGRIHSIETFGSVDGPGIRFIIFLKDCHLRCRYCHNPDTWATTTCEMRSADELIEMAKRYRDYWGETGGITISGGDPLLQIDFCLALAKRAKEEGIHVCIDTAAEPFTREEPFFSKFNALLKYTDLFLMDLKVMDNERHIFLTGKGNTNILDCVKYLSEKNIPVWIRHVLVPDVTDNEKDLLKMRQFLDTLQNVEKTEILPYHTMGIYKYVELGIPYRLGGVKEPDEESVRRAEKLLGISK